jgi:hypothetical protein
MAREPLSRGFGRGETASPAIVINRQDRYAGAVERADPVEPTVPAPTPASVRTG